MVCHILNRIFVEQNQWNSHWCGFKIDPLTHVWLCSVHCATINIFNKFQKYHVGQWRWIIGSEMQRFADFTKSVCFVIEQLMNGWQWGCISSANSWKFNTQSIVSIVFFFGGQGRTHTTCKYISILYMYYVHDGISHRPISLYYIVVITIFSLF